MALVYFKQGLGDRVGDRWTWFLERAWCDLGWRKVTLVHRRGLIDWGGNRWPWSIEGAWVTDVEIGGLGL